MPTATSPLTKLEVECTREARTDTTYYSDPACGDYGVGFDDAVRVLSESDRTKIGKVLATKKLRSGASPLLLTVDRTGEHGAWTCVPTRQLLAQYPKDVVSVLDEALINLSVMIQFPSDPIEITDVSRWNIFAHDHDSEAYILRQLSEMGYIKASGARPGGTYMIQRVTIDAKGWSRLQMIQSDSAVSDQAFVAMWFDEQMHEFYDEGIEPAITELGYRCVRIDLKEHNNKICDEIIAEIRRSRFLVADFSGNRGGVYYEAGFAHGLGRPVIWAVREDHLEGVHFDTRQYNHIVYGSTEELRDKLSARIRATIK